MIVLDTQHVSQHQVRDSKDHARLNARLDANPDHWITVITPYEQVREVLGKINGLAAHPEKQSAAYTAFVALLDYYADCWQGRILSFDAGAVAVYQSFDPRLVRRIGGRDARIAAIALAQGAAVATANVADFRQVPGLRVENWLEA